MSEALIVTCTPYIDAGVIAAKHGDARSVKYYLGLPFARDFFSIDDQEKYDKLSMFVHRSAEIEKVFGTGALLDLNEPGNQDLIALGKISVCELENAKSFRGSDQFVDPAALLEARSAI